MTAPPVLVGVVGTEATLNQYRRLVDSGKGALDKSAIAELTFKDRAGN